MLEKEFYVIAFESTHHAIKTEAMLKKGFKIETIPTPREISASCGLSIKFSLDLFPKIKNVLDIEGDGFNVFKVKKEGSHKHVEKII